MDELYVTVVTHDMFQLYMLVSHGLKTMWIQLALLCMGFAWREKIGVMDEPVMGDVEMI